MNPLSHLHRCIPSSDIRPARTVSMTIDAPSAGKAPAMPASAFPCFHPPGTDATVLPSSTGGVCRSARNRLVDPFEPIRTIGSGRCTCQRSSHLITERVYNTRTCSQAARETQDIVHGTVDRAGDTTVIPVDNFSACGSFTAFGHRNRAVEVERGRAWAARGYAILGPRGAVADPDRTGRASIDVAREHPIRVLAQRRHEHVK